MADCDSSRYNGCLVSTPNTKIPGLPSVSNFFGAGRIGMTHTAAEGHTHSRQPSSAAPPEPSRLARGAHATRAQPHTSPGARQRGTPLLRICSRGRVEARVPPRPGARPHLRMQPSSPAPDQALGVSTNCTWLTCPSSRTTTTRISLLTCEEVPAVACQNSPRYYVDRELGAPAASRWGRSSRRRTCTPRPAPRRRQ